MSDGDLIVDIKGLEELQKKLEAHDARTPLAVRKAIRASAKVVKAGIVEMAPRHSGFLAEHFSISYRNVNRALATAYAYIFPNSKDVYPE